MPTDLTGNQTRANAGLVDVLDRVLDKGLVVAGDIKVSLAEVELLTIRIRLMICSIDKAEEIGLDWWKYDRHLSPGREQVMQENLELREQLQLLERHGVLTREAVNAEGIEGGFSAVYGVLKVLEERGQVRRVCAGEDTTALCLVRPPGHHARPHDAMGFCLFNSAAIAASAAVKTNCRLVRSVR